MHNVQLALCIAIFFILQLDVNSYIMDMYVCTSFVKVQISHIKSRMSLIISQSFHICIRSDLGKTFLPFRRTENISAVYYNGTIYFPLCEKISLNVCTNKQFSCQDRFLNMDVLIEWEPWLQRVKFRISGKRDLNISSYKKPFVGLEYHKD